MEAPVGPQQQEEPAAPPFEAIPEELPALPAAAAEEEEAGPVHAATPPQVKLISICVAILNRFAASEHCIGRIAGCITSSTPLYAHRGSKCL